MFVASHVTTVFPVAKVIRDEGVHDTTGLVPVAEGSVYKTTGSHEDISDGQAPMTGLSLMVTLKVHELGEPHPLEAVQVTTVVPATKVEPEEGTQVTVAAGSPVEVGSVQEAMPSSH